MTAGDSIRINLGCASEVAALPPASVDLVLMDPPYMSTDLDLEASLDPDKLARILAALRLALKPAGWLFCFGGLRQLHRLFPTFCLKFEYIWVKPSPIITTPVTVRPSNQHEIIGAFHHPDLKRPTDLYFDREALRTTGHANYSSRRFAASSTPTEYCGQQRVALSDRSPGVQDGTRGPSSLLFYPAKPQFAKIERTPHPTQKPIALLKTLIRGYCPPDGLVCDPFLGSGSTALAARDAGRRFVGWEIDPKWHALATRRCSDPLMAGGGGGGGSADMPPAEKKRCDP